MLLIQKVSLLLLKTCVYPRSAWFLIRSWEWWKRSRGRRWRPWSRIGGRWLQSRWTRSRGSRSGEARFEWSGNVSHFMDNSWYTLNKKWWIAYSLVKMLLHFRKSSQFMQIEKSSNMLWSTCTDFHHIYSCLRNVNKLYITSSMKMMTIEYIFLWKSVLPHQFPI